jgi:isopenicillin N synthase-like dioxygenase
MGKNLPLDDQYVIEKRFGQGPNKYPAELRDPKEFQRVMERYHEMMTALAVNLLQVLACTLNLNTNFFDDFCEHPVAALRLLHYPPQDPAATEVEKGMSPCLKPSKFLILANSIYRHWRSHGLWRHNNTSSRSDRWSAGLE